MKEDIVCVSDAVNEIGEGPLWSSREQALYWVDVGLRAKKLLRYRPTSSGTDVWELEHRAATLMQRASGGLVVGFQRGLSVMQNPPHQLRELPLQGVNFEIERFNDSAVDRSGRLWIGTFDRKLKEPLGALYRIDGSLSAKAVDRGFMMSNGLAWSPDNRTLYFCDSRPGRIYAYDFDLASGTAEHRRVFMDFAGRQGRPDGCTIDAEGCLWVAEIDAGQLLRLDPAGRIARTVPLPISRPTSLAFGGDALRTCFITSMTFGLAEAQRAAQPLAGRLLAFEPGVAGLPEPLLDF